MNLPHVDVSDLAEVGDRVLVSMPEGIGGSGPGVVTRVSTSDTARLMVQCDRYAEHTDFWVHNDFVSFPPGPEPVKGQPFDSRPATLHHIQRVRQYLAVVTRDLEARAVRHDESKLQDPEKAEFDRVGALRAGLVYPSPEYDACRKEIGPALAHHYEHNSHHPEHFGLFGAHGMSLLDLMEMVCDWKASGERDADGGDIVRSIHANQQRFHYPDFFKCTLLATARAMGWVPADVAAHEMSQVVITEATREARRNSLEWVVKEVHGQKGDDCCWMDIDRIFRAAGLPVPDRKVGDKAAMLENCKRYIDTMCSGGDWASYAQVAEALDVLDRLVRAHAATAPILNTVGYIDKVAPAVERVRAQT